MRLQEGVGAWSAVGGLYGTKSQISDARKALKSTLYNRVEGLLFLNERTLVLGKYVADKLWFTKWGQKLQYKVTNVRPVYDLLKGVPNSQTLRGAYWRKSGEMGNQYNDPALDKCGLLWLSPILPMTGEAVNEVMGLVEPIFAEYELIC